MSYSVATEIIAVGIKEKAICKNCFWFSVYKENGRTYCAEDFPNNKYVNANDTCRFWEHNKPD